MNADQPEQVQGSVLQDTLLLLAREQEWAEAYAADHPRCELGMVYLDFLRKEITTLMAAL